MSTSKSGQNKNNNVTMNNHMEELKYFEKTELRKVKTEVRNTLPSKETIEQEKESIQKWKEHRYYWS
ncbi:thymosin beta-11-like [Glandiceps talaboti]